MTHIAARRGASISRDNWPSAPAGIELLEGVQAHRLAGAGRAAP